MKKYRKLVTQKIFNCEYYIPTEDTYGKNTPLQAIHWALEEFYYEDLFIRCLHDPDFDFYGGNEGFIQKVGNMIELYTPHDELSVKPGETATPSAIVNIENLKVLAQDWKELYERHVPFMYLIVEDNGWVTLRERLEE